MHTPKSDDQVERLQPNNITILGHVCPKGEWIKIQETTQHVTTGNAVLQLAAQLPDINTVVAARFGKQAAILPPMSKYDTSLVIVWPHHHPDNMYYLW